ncbi:uncharacterized protein RHOBADRAFT_53207 [Rhodotorula graminis WP1]|uniref:Uncharacterized protein n=1 Tax=Rhodotorula graminis (strain WP1) TaxID=578459 RepID=A0A194S701_RHOGW|nr:uncharacterized protein RHOBADRAFT_53207 [Rhodotorula graminis WP1]KPV75196.1 hypothetical protein RHOBADRAFT_53207 [Rhodotorula graminis WP1]
MSTPQLSAAFASLAQSAATLRSLRFERSAVLPRAVLGPDELVETLLLRDALPHELALFEPAPASADVIPHDADEVAQMGLLASSSGDDKWMAAKRKGPRRAARHADKPSPLKARRQGGAGGPDADRCLRAAQQLLDIYTLPRAQEHVEALKSQHAGIVQSLNTLEEALRRPVSRTAPQPQNDASFYRKLELEDAIKREQLEVFALEQLKADKEVEVAAVASSSRPSSRAAPGPTATRGGRVPSVVARARGGSTSARPRASQPRTSTSPARSPARAGSATPPPAPAPTSRSARLAQHLEDMRVLSSPARRPIGAEARAAAHASLMAGRPSVGTRPSFGAGRPSVGTRPSVGGARASMGGAADERARRDAEEDDNEGDSTPKAARRASRPAAEAASPSPRKLAPPVPVVRSPAKPAAAPARAARPALPAGVTPVELSSAAETIWSTLGEVNGLTRWGRKWAREQDEGAAEKEQRVVEGKSGWEETLTILQYALANSSSPDNAGPSSPSSHSITSFSTSTTGGAGDGDVSAPSWTPAQVVEAQLCHLLLSVLSGAPPPPPPSASSALPPLAIILRDSLLGSTRKTPHLGMTALKAHLGAFAKGRGWTEEMGTTAIYALVSKQTVKTDRRGREGAAVAFRVVEAA